MAPHFHWLGDAAQGAAKVQGGQTNRGRIIYLDKIVPKRDPVKNAERGECQIDSHGYNSALLDEFVQDRLLDNPSMIVLDAEVMFDETRPEFYIPPDDRASMLEDMVTQVRRGLPGSKTRTTYAGPVYITGDLMNTHASVYRWGSNSPGLLRLKMEESRESYAAFDGVCYQMYSPGFHVQEYRKLIHAGDKSAKDHVARLVDYATGEAARMSEWCRGPYVGPDGWLPYVPLLWPQVATPGTEVKSLTPAIDYNIAQIAALSDHYIHDIGMWAFFGTDEQSWGLRNDDGTFATMSDITGEYFKVGGFVEQFIEAMQ